MWSEFLIHILLANFVWLLLPFNFPGTDYLNILLLLYCQYRDTESTLNDWIRCCSNNKIPYEISAFDKKTCARNIFNIVGKTFSYLLIFKQFCKQLKIYFTKKIQFIFLLLLQSNNQLPFALKIPCIPYKDEFKSITDCNQF